MRAPPLHCLGRSVARSLAATAALAVAVWAPNVAAGRTPARLLQVEEPHGFAGLTGPQLAVVDVYFGGRRVGTADIQHLPDKLTFLSPQSVLRLLPDIQDTAAVGDALAASMATNSHLVCAVAADITSCGTLRPETVGAIFDRDRFRVDIFVNPRFLGVRPATDRTYLQSPDKRLSFLASLDAVASGSDRNETFYNVQNHLLVGLGPARLRADLAFASKYGLQSDRLAVELDRPDWRYSVGAFWTPGLDVLSRRKLVGIGIETQVDTRLDKDVVRGTPLVVFLSQRARVDILLNDRVLASRIYEAGNQTIDTSGLPDGTYEIVLRIDELGGGRRDEKRLFTRSPRIPSIGQDMLFGYVGALVDDRANEFLDLTNHPLIQLGAAHRINSAISLDATLIATDRAAVGEVGGYVISRPAQIRIALVADSRGSYGGLMQLNSNGGSPFNFHFDLRRMVVNDDGAARPKFGVDDLSDLSLARASYTQASGNISYSLRNMQISLAASLRDEEGVGRTYAIGPSVRWTFLRKGDWRLLLNGDAAVTDRGSSGYVGLHLQFTGRRLALAAKGGARISDSAGDRRKSGFVGSIDGAIQREILGGTADLRAGYEHELERDLVNATANLRTRAASLNADLLHTFGAEASQLQYSVGVHTTVVGVGGTLALQGRERSDGMVVVNVEGAQPQDRFEVLIDEARVATVAGGGEVAIPVLPYREYDVRIRPDSGGLVQYDGSPKRIAVYPGSVAALRWKARTVVPVFGRIRVPGSATMTGATILLGDGTVEVDDSGFFQVDAGPGELLQVRLSDGRTCQVELPSVASAANYAAAGDVLCDPTVRLGSVQLSEGPK